MVNKFILKIIPLFIKKKIECKGSLIRILNNINWLTLEKIVRGGLLIFVSILLARYLGPEKFGTLNYAISFVALFTAFSKLGLDNIVIRNLVNFSSKQGEILGSTFFLKLLGNIILSIFSVFLIYLIRPLDSTIQLFVLIISMGYIFKSFDTIDFWFQSKVMSKYVAISLIASGVIFFCINFAFLIINAPLVSFIWAYVIDFALTSLGLFIFYQSKSEISIFKWKIRVHTMKNLIHDSWPLILSGLAIMMNLRIDQIMIGQMINSDALGVYSVAVTLSESWYFIPMIITGSIFPVMITLRDLDKKLYFKKLQRVYDIFTWFSIGIAIVITFLSNSVISLLYGPNYMGASTVLSIQIWAGVFVFFGVVSARYFVIENLTKISLYRPLIGMGINIILNFILIPKYGIIGASISTLISYFFASCLSNIFFKESRIVFYMFIRSLNIIRIIKELK